MSGITVIPTDVIDVQDDHYVLRTSNGETYKMPTGTVQLEHGQFLAISENCYMKIQLPREKEDSEESPEASTSASSTSTTTTSGSSASASPTSASSVSTNGIEMTAEKKNSAEWSDEATKFLIDLYREFRPLVDDRKIKTMRRMWEKISSETRKQGYNYSPLQIKSKWKSLERAFKAKMVNSKKTGRGRYTCPYERPLADILLKRTSIVPPCVLDESTMKSREELLEESQIEDPADETSTGDTTADDSTITEADNRSRISIVTSTPRPRSTSRPQNQELTVLAEAMNARTRLKEEMERKKIEQRERLIKALEERNELLRSLVAKSSSTAGA